MATEKQLNEKVEALRAEYQKGYSTKSATELNKLTDKIKAAMDERAALLAKGANKDPLTGSPAIGMKVGKGVYEVGGPDSNLRARGETAAEAVENWNNGEYHISPTNPDADKAAIAQLKSAKPKK